MNRLSTLFFAAALLIVSVAALALVVRAGVVTPDWAPMPAAADSAPAPGAPGPAARL